MPKRISSEEEIEVGDFYEDCRFHPRLCIQVSIPDGFPDDIKGISLIDGSVCACSIKQCGLRILTTTEAIRWKLEGPTYLPNLERMKNGWKQ